MIDDYEEFIKDLVSIQDRLPDEKDKAVIDLTLWMVRGIQKMDALLEMKEGGGMIQ